MFNKSLLINIVFIVSFFIQASGQQIDPMANPRLANFSGHVLLDGDTGLNGWTVYVWDSSYNIVASATTYTKPGRGAGYYALPAISTNYAGQPNPDCDTTPHYDITVTDNNNVTRMWFRDFHLCSGFHYLNFMFFWDDVDYTESSCQCTDGLINSL